MKSSDIPLIVIRGAGDLGSGVAFRLFTAGYPVLMTELDKPLLVRRTVSFGDVMYAETGSVSIEGITARRIDVTSALWLALQTREIPILLDIEDDWQSLNPEVVVDARIAKRNIDTQMADAQLVIALGPGFVAGEDCHAVIETNRGHRLGRVIWRGSAEPNTATPGNVMGAGAKRVLRAPCDGLVMPHAEIGDLLDEGDLIATVGDKPIYAPFRGRLRGLIHPTVRIVEGMKIGDIDPRGVYEHCFTVSDKSLAIGGGVLEAILSQGIHPIKTVNQAEGSIDALT